MKQLKLSNSDLHCLIDDNDFEKFGKYTWRLAKGRSNNKPKAVIRGEKVDGKYTTIYLHREIMDASPELVVDHRDRNPLNNQKANLRLCTSAENSRNTEGHSDRKSRFKGVFHHTQGKRLKRWVAKICQDHTVYHIGYYTTEIEAAQAYDKAARAKFGEFVKCNFEL